MSVVNIKRLTLHQNQLLLVMAQFYFLIIWQRKATHSVASGHEEFHKKIHESSNLHVNLDRLSRHNTDVAKQPRIIKEVAGTHNPNNYSLNCKIVLRYFFHFQISNCKNQFTERLSLKFNFVIELSDSWQANKNIRRNICFIFKFLLFSHTKSFIGQCLIIGKHPDQKKNIVLYKSNFI